MAPPALILPLLLISDTRRGLLYAEFNSTGPGANPSRRVWWSKQLGTQEAASWTRESVLRGWDPVADAAAQSPHALQALQKAYGSANVA